MKLFPSFKIRTEPKEGVGVAKLPTVFVGDPEGLAGVVLYPHETIGSKSQAKLDIPKYPVMYETDCPNLLLDVQNKILTSGSTCSGTVFWEETPHTKLHALHVALCGSALVRTIYGYYLTRGISGAFLDELLVSEPTNLLNETTPKMGLNAFPFKIPIPAHMIPTVLSSSTGGTVRVTYWVSVYGTVKQQSSLE